MGAAVHAERTADAARDAAIERKAGNAGIGSGARDLHVGHGGTGAEPGIVLDGDVAETAAEPYHHATDAAVAHKQIGSESDNGDGNLGRRIRHEIREVGLRQRANRGHRQGRRRGTR